MPRIAYSDAEGLSADFASSSSATPHSLEAYRARLHGLTTDPRRLQAIRTTQRTAGSRYASREHCERETRRTERLFQRVGVPVCDTTSASVEEIAAAILARVRQASVQGQLTRRPGSGGPRPGVWNRRRA